MLRFVSCTLAALWLGLGPAQGLSGPLRLVVLGDMPYGAPETTYPPFETLIGAINARAPDLVIHVGDTKSGRTPCSDAHLDEQRAFMMQVAAPLLYTPGDNEWTDCHDDRAGGHDPRARLARIRATYFATPGQSLGARPLPVTHQGAAGYPENARLMLGDVMVMTAHVVGSNNGFEPRDTATAREAIARDAANRAWLARSFATAQEAGAGALILAIHADMFEFGFAPRWDAEGFLRHSGFARFAGALIDEANRFARPVLLTYGDSHRFRMFRPFPDRAPGIMALETFGAANMHAVEVTVETGAGYPFAVRPLLNPAQPLVPRP
jgi:hypothetical protein